MEKAHKDEINHKHLAYKEQLDSVEVEFKKALGEIGEKYKKVKKEYEDLVKSDGESRNILKITLTRNGELEGIIS